MYDMKYEVSLFSFSISILTITSIAIAIAPISHLCRLYRSVWLNGLHRSVICKWDGGDQDNGQLVQWWWWWYRVYLWFCYGLDEVGALHKLDMIIGIESEDMRIWGAMDEWANIALCWLKFQIQVNRLDQGCGHWGWDSSDYGYLLGDWKALPDGMSIGRIIIASERPC